jgi:hypothetical protein
LQVNGLHTDDDPAIPFSRVLPGFRLGILIFLYLLPVRPIISQAPYSSVQERDSMLRYIHKEYGLNQELINGIQFYQRYSFCEGDPYFPSDKFYRGVLHLREGESHQVQMKYDIFAQQLVVGYTDYGNRYNQVIIDSIRIDSFQIGKYLFKKLDISGFKPMFYQVYTSGQVSCFIHWTKRMIPASFRGLYTHRFSDPDGYFFLMYRGKVQSFDNRKTLFSILPEAIQFDLKKYLRQQKIRISGASIDEIEGLIYFIDKKLELQPNH